VTIPFTSCLQNLWPHSQLKLTISQQRFSSTVRNGQEQNFYCLLNILEFFEFFHKWKTIHVRMDKPVTFNCFVSTCFEWRKSWHDFFWCAQKWWVAEIISFYLNFWTWPRQNMSLAKVLALFKIFSLLVNSKMAIWMWISEHSGHLQSFITIVNQYVFFVSLA
jgi:hypothetical protein